MVNFKTAAGLVGGSSPDRVIASLKCNFDAQIVREADHMIAQGALLAEARSRFSDDKSFAAWLCDSGIAATLTLGVS